MDEKKVEGAAAAAPRQKEAGLWDSIEDKFIETFSSPKLAIFTFIILAILSIFGTVVEQNREPAMYIAQYGEKWYGIIRVLGFTDIFHAWYFTLMIILLSINLSVCFFRRLPPKWRLINDKTVVMAEDAILRQKNSVKLNHNINIKAMKDIIVKIFRKDDQVWYKDWLFYLSPLQWYIIRKRYKVIVEETDSHVSIFAYRGAIGRIGSDITHVGLLIIFLGVIIGSFFGFKGFATIFEGEARRIPNTDFDIRVDKFWIEYYDDYKIKDFFSALTVIDNGKEVMKKTIEVNDPLKYKGVWFYQSSYGQAWDRVEKARFFLVDKKTKNLTTDVIADFGVETPVPNTDIKIKVIGFVADFYYDPESKQIFSKSMEHNNPAIQIEVYEKGVLKSTPWLFAKYPEAFIDQSTKYFIEIGGYKAPQWTGLSIAKDPGVNIVWVGSTLLTLGLFLSFFVIHRRIWIKIVDKNNKVDIYVGGNANKNKINFDKDFSNLIEELNRIGK
ncbi:MAG: cytochrome c biogenesis protein ResB [Nitrospirae bacterium]|nr:cytochrome c biogenesis protein ResB [Nitrospirota bacterium]